jgi:hypothetical protein
MNEPVPKSGWRRDLVSDESGSGEKRLSVKLGRSVFPYTFKAVVPKNEVLEQLRIRAEAENETG